MFERFTDRARMVIALANQEAQRFHHEYIEDVHILLGLVREGSGVGATILQNLDVDLKKLRVEVEKLIEPGPDIVVMGKLPQTPRAKKVIENALLEARKLNHNYVGTEHILLGLIWEAEGTAAQILMKIGLNLKDVRQEVYQMLGANPEEGETLVRKVIKEAASDEREMLNLRHWEIESLPAEIGNLSNLRELLLGDNQLRALPAEIGNLAKLERLEVSRNKLTELPRELGRLANLQELYVSDNHLTRIPAELGKLKKLRSLELSGNPLESPPAEVVERGTEAVLAYLRETLEGRGEGEVVQEVFDTDEDLRIAFEKYIVNEKGYTSKNYSTEQYGDEYAVTQILDNERNKVLALIAFCLDRIGADKAFEGIMEFKKKRGISGVPNYVIFANEDPKISFAMFEYGDGGGTHELPYRYFPTFELAKFICGLSFFCSILTQMVLGRTASLGLNTEFSGDGSYINLRRGTKNVAAQIHKYGTSQNKIGLALAGYSQEYHKPKSEHMKLGENTELSGYQSNIAGERAWLNGNMGRQICPASVYVVDSMERFDASVLKEVLEEVMKLVGLAKEKMLEVIEDEGEYHAPIAVFSGDGVRDAEGRLVDQLDIEPEVNAMSSLIAARDIKWPLSIGLFGDWGSGKSFFMEMMYDRIKKISGESDRWVEAGNKSDYCRNVVQIRFNAWHYMDSNLWASLVTHIFDELAKEVSSRGKADVEETRKVLFENLESAKKLKDEAEEHEKKAADLRESAESKLTKVEEERADAEKELKHITARDVIALAKDDARIKEQCRQVAEKFGLAEIGAEVENIRDIVREANKVFGRVMLVWRTISSRRKGKIKLLGLIGLILGLPIFVGLVAWWVSDSAFAAQLTGVIGIIGSFITGHMKALKPRLAGINKGLAQWEKAQEQILNIGNETTRAEIELREEIKALKEQENKARQEVEDAEKGVQRAKEELDEIRTGRRLQRLIEEGSSKSEYLDKLGIIAVIRKDFEDLKNLVSESSEQVTSGELPRIDRIVLYVDDLDRCTSQRVVEVLQAVHLILGFKLFVVVVAVDSRWILHALREEYSAFGGIDDATVRLGRRWLTTPQNYVEKIFQIPFALRPMGDTGYKKLVEKLTEEKERKVVVPTTPEPTPTPPEPTQPGSTPPQSMQMKHTMEEFEPTIEMKPPSANLSKQEAEFMKAMGDLIPSPRAAKRFVNIYRLTLASVDDRGKLDELRGTKNRPGDYQAVLLMLAILTGFPRQGADILTTLANGGGKCNGILDFMSKLKTENKTNSDPVRYSNGVRKGILEADRAVWYRLSNILKEKIGELGVKDSLEPFVRWADWVARFSFQYKPVISEEEGGEEDG
ncbi:MAG: hypothetical protein FVQ85_03435 [Planctomycetes bacterium]|nr:hypothetical protein [Planctomycetota bacterium]